MLRIAATKGKAQWSATVATKDWGEPAPNFAGSRTLLIRYAVDGRERFKAVYEGREIESDATAFLVRRGFRQPQAMFDTVQIALASE